MLKYLNRQRTLKRTDRQNSQSTKSGNIYKAHKTKRNTRTTKHRIQTKLARCQVRHICKAHKANLVKEPALFLPFRDTPCFGGHRHSIHFTKTKGKHILGLPQVWLSPVALMFKSSTIRFALRSKATISIPLHPANASLPLMH